MRGREREEQPETGSRSSSGMKRTWSFWFVRVNFITSVEEEEEEECGVVVSPTRGEWSSKKRKCNDFVKGAECMRRVVVTCWTE